MADEMKKDHPEDIEAILSALDAILTDMGSVTPLSPREGIIKPPEKKTEPPQPVPKLPDQKPIEVLPDPAISVGIPKEAPPQPVKAEPLKPPVVPVPVPKVDIQPPTVPNPPTAVPVEVPVVTLTQIEEFPLDTPKEQIRRVAYIYTFVCAGVKTDFAAFLSQAARTISKRPLFLREVMSHEVGAVSDTNAVLKKALQVKASVILAVVEAWPSAKVDELAEACLRSNILFRVVAPADSQKKSTAVDIIVDMMLLQGEF